MKYVPFKSISLGDEKVMQKFESENLKIGEDVDIDGRVILN
jgi:hypothetical protein